jgi:predicted transcriptional regulator
LTYRRRRELEGIHRSFAVDARMPYTAVMSTERPKYDPAELAKYDMTEEEAEAVREGLEQIDRGEAVDGKESFARVVPSLKP